MSISIGKDPTGLAAAAIYVASILTDERVTQKKISEISNVTEVTIRHRYKELVRECILMKSCDDEKLEISA